MLLKHYASRRSAQVIGCWRLLPLMTAGKLPTGVSEAIIGDFRWASCRIGQLHDVLAAFNLCSQRRKIRSLTERGKDWRPHLPERGRLTWCVALSVGVGWMGASVSGPWLLHHWRR